MAGIAPEDDDGNAAAKAAPKPPSSAQMKRDLETLDAGLSDCYSEVALTKLWKEWAAKMNADNWPPAEPDDETSFRNAALDKFRARKIAMSEQDDADIQDAKVITA